MMGQFINESTMDKSTSVGQKKAGIQSLRMIGKFIRNQPIWLVVILCLIIFGLSSPYFFTVSNLSDVLLQSSIIGFIAIAMTFIILNANIDLTVGSLLALSANIVVGFESHGMVLAVLASLLAGVVIGAINGFFVTRAGINSFIVTLGAMLGVRGLVFVLTKQQSFVAENPALSNFGALQLGPISIIVIFFLVFVVIGQWVLKKTSHGRNAIAIGGNYDAALNAGVRVKLHIFINFIVSGIMASVAGIMMASEMGAATPTLGTDYELWSITAVVLGGTKLQGGFGSVIRTLGGVLVIGILRNGMDLLHVQSYYVLVLMGVILIAVIFIDKQVSRAK
ncbi:ABC transporter permease [Fodinisporobacter ferrooxydans]|uniref:ABC transporter permease n=1 Tax=Fodinisporobacter ferrooxydans TaxID=2901836 RepID=A0ABY4CKB2_9BACL|nr:ABC transporter permease [Alicyclobacillaceae bacterium MYW30-H2]